MSTSSQPSNTTPTASTSTTGIAAAPGIVMSHHYKPLVKLPTFTPEAPDLFFMLMEAANQQRGISDPFQQFLSTFMQCPQRVQLQAKYLISSSVPDKLDELKTIVNTLYAVPAEQKLTQLLASNSLGDMRPSEYLRHIRDLQGTGSDPNSLLIRSHFTKCMPASVAPFIEMMMSSHDLDSIAKAADNLTAINTPRVSAPISAVTINQQEAQLSLLTEQLNAMKYNQQHESGIDLVRKEIQQMNSNNSHQFKQLQEQINGLNSRMNSIQQQISYNSQSYMQQHQPRRERSISQNRTHHPHFSTSTTPSPSTPPSATAPTSAPGPSSARYQNFNPNFCIYHNRFGETAIRCIQPCSFNSTRTGN